MACPLDPTPKIYERSPPLLGTRYRADIICLGVHVTLAFLSVFNHYFVLYRASFMLLILLGWFSLVVTSLGKSTKLLYARPG